MLVKSGVTCDCLKCNELITTGDYKFSYGKKVFCFKCGFGKHKVLLKEIPYEMQFYWKGRRYKQILRPKHKKGSFKIVCYEINLPDGEWLSMPSGRVIKPVIKVCQ